jgi:hypothetical protein
MMAIVAVLGVLAYQCTACADDDKGKTGAVAALTENIRGSSSHLARVDAADALWNFVWKMDEADHNAIDPETIDAISALLSDRDGYLVYIAAAVLGRIGTPAALRSVPVLMKALREIRMGSKRELQSGGFGSEDTIVGALQALKVCVPKGPNGRNACDYLIR